MNDTHLTDAGITGVHIKGLVLHSDERGDLLEILRADDTIFDEFGQVYITTVKQGFVKAWHLHTSQTDYFTCVNGVMRLALFDDRPDSDTAGHVLDLRISRNEPCVVKIPPNVWHGFECVQGAEALVVNVVTRPYNHEAPDEERRDPFDAGIPFRWNGTSGW